VTRDLEGYFAALEDGVVAAAGTGSDAEILLLAAEARADCVQLGQPERGIERADHALQLGRGRSELEARLQFVAGANRFGANRPEAEWRPHLEAALAAGRASGDFDTELRAAEMLAFGSIMSGRPSEARALAEQTAERARELKLIGRERRLQIWMCGADWHAGFPQRGADLAERLAQQPLEFGDAELLTFYRTQCLADTGRCDEACRLLREALEDAVSDVEGLGDFLWALSDAELLAGRPRAALEAADDWIGRFPGDNRESFVRVNRAWACVELGVDPGLPFESVSVPLFEAVPLETQALAQLATDDRRAAELFRDAADLWDGRHVRGRLRCLWAAGDAFRRAGQLDTARELLVEGERLAEEGGFEPLLRRIRRSLRLAGDRRAATRTRDHRGLTGREVEVLELVSAGLSNAAIAGRLGVGRPTVARLISSASRKLGARSRVQAAALARRQ
jgi:DNA-binding CsgD family transcriptional regulator